VARGGIVTIHSIEQDGDVRFLTMERVEGQSLDQVIPRGGLPLGQVLEIGATLADALAASHEKGIIHRDLKPANIMLAGRERRVKVLDFGLAKLREEAASDGETTTAAHRGNSRRSRARRSTASPCRTTDGRLRSRVARRRLTSS
jgi:serine/threonine protein kinase